MNRVYRPYYHLHTELYILLSMMITSSKEKGTQDRPYGGIPEVTANQSENDENDFLNCSASKLL